MLLVLVLVLLLCFAHPWELHQHVIGEQRADGIGGGAYR